MAIANSRGPDTLRDLAAEIGATAVTAKEAARGRDLVILAIPERAAADLPKDLFKVVPDDVVVIDTGNYYPTRDGSIPPIEKGKPKGTPGRIALPVAGDPPAARARVMRLVDDLGFDPVNGGSLDESWRQQPGTPCYTKDLDAPRLQLALVAAQRDLVPAYRKAAEDALKALLSRR